MDNPIAVLPAGEPPGFPQCPKCPYRRMGPAWICVECASKTLEAIARRACPICSQRLEDDSPCRNSLCRDRNRRIERIDAIAYHSGPLQDKIHSYKYDGKLGWSLIFGRLLIGWLEAHAGDPPDLIVANPTYTDPASRVPATSRRSSNQPQRPTTTTAGPSTSRPPRRSSKHRPRNNRPGEASQRSGPLRQPSAGSWRSPIRPARKGATSSCSTTWALPDTS
jgi:hypothetical protein